MFRQSLIGTGAQIQKELTHQSYLCLIWRNGFISQVVFQFSSLLSVGTQYKAAGNEKTKEHEYFSDNGLAAKLPINLLWKPAWGHPGLTLGKSLQGREQQHSLQSVFVGFSRVFCLFSFGLVFFYLVCCPYLSIQLQFLLFQQSSPCSGSLGSYAVTSHLLLE